MAQTIKPRTLLGLVTALALALAPAVAQAGNAAVPFVAQGPFVISLGEGIQPAGNSGRFVVPERHVYGILFGSVSAPYGFAPFEIEFHTNVPITTQSGNVQGTLSICEGAAPTYWPPLLWCAEASSVNPLTLDLDNPVFQAGAVTRAANIHLTTSLGATPVACLGDANPYVPCTNGFSKGLLLDGGFTFTGGTANGGGSLTGFLVLMLGEINPDGTLGAPCSDLGPVCHIVGIAFDPTQPPEVAPPLSLLKLTGTWKP